MVHCAGMLDSDGCVSSSMQGKFKARLQLAVTFNQSNKVLLQEIQAMFPAARGSVHAVKDQPEGWATGGYTQASVHASLLVLLAGAHMPVCL